MSKIPSQRDPVKCKTPECANMVVPAFGREFCGPCAEHNNRLSKRANKRRDYKSLKVKKAAAQAKINPPSPLVSNEEQRQIDTEVHQRLAARCGYGNSDPRSLTREEIEAVAHLYQPPQKEDRPLNSDYSHRWTMPF